MFGPGAFCFTVTSVSTSLHLPYIGPYLEIETQGALPYAGMSNQKVWVSVMDGYRLPQPGQCSGRGAVVFDRTLLIAAYSRQVQDYVSLLAKYNE
jgi:hypothetical protein